MALKTVISEQGRKEGAKQKLQPLEKESPTAFCLPSGLKFCGAQDDSELNDDVRLKDLIVAIPRDWVLVCGSWNVARRVTTVKIPIQRIGIVERQNSG